MKNTWTYLIISMCLSLLFLFSACKKDSEQDNNENTSSCYILRLSDDPEGYIEIKFIYNNQNQLIRMDAREDDYQDYKTMQYDDSGNLVRIEYYEDDGTLAAYQTFEYSNGKVIKGYEYANSSAMYEYNYNANGLLESISFSSIAFSSSISNVIPNNMDGLLSSCLLNAEAFMDKNTSLYSAIIKFQWNSSGSVAKESWFSGETLLESYEYTYDNKINPFKQFNFPVPLIGGNLAKTISSNNFTKEVWYSVINGSSETTTATYQYNSSGYPISMDDEYHMEYMCN